MNKAYFYFWNYFAWRSFKGKELSVNVKNKTVKSLVLASDCDLWPAFQIYAKPTSSVNIVIPGSHTLPGGPLLTLFNFIFAFLKKDHS